MLDGEETLKEKAPSGGMLSDDEQTKKEEDPGGKNLWDGEIVVINTKTTDKESLRRLLSTRI